MGCSLSSNEHTSCAAIGGQKPKLREEPLDARLGRIPISGRYHGDTRKIEQDYIVTQQVLSSSCNGEVRIAMSRSQHGQNFVVKSIPRRSRANLGFLKKDSDMDQLSEVENHLCMDHPHITRLLDVYETKENFHLVMEYMEGGDLHEFVIDNGRCSEQEARKAIHQMLLALDYIHRQGVVHRDVKLENFLRDSKGSLQLTDFGFSRSCGASGKEEWTDGCGSVGYIAPEVVKCIRGQKSGYSTQCDMWSVGVIGFILLSGVMPFTGDEAARMSKISRGRYNMKPELWSSVSPDGINFIQALLTVCPSKRLTARTALKHPWFSPIQGEAAASFVVKRDDVSGTDDTTVGSGSDHTPTDVVFEDREHSDDSREWL